MITFIIDQSFDYLMNHFVSKMSDNGKNHQDDLMKKIPNEKKQRF